MGGRVAARVLGAASAVATLATLAGCREPSRHQPAPRAAPAAVSARAAAASAPVPAESAAPPPAFDEKEADAILEVVNRLPLVDKACGLRCSFTIDRDERYWIATVGSDRSPAPLTPLHLFSVFVDPDSRKPVSIEPGAMYGFCRTPIPIEKWGAYAARYQRFLDGQRKTPEPECP